MLSCSVWKQYSKEHNTVDHGQTVCNLWSYDSDNIEIKSELIETGQTSPGTVHPHFSIDTTPRTRCDALDHLTISPVMHRNWIENYTLAMEDINGYWQQQKICFHHHLKLKLLLEKLI